MTSSASFERAMWLAKWRTLAERKELAGPPAGEIPRMLAAVGNDPTFQKLSKANKDELFLAMYNIRLWLETYDKVVAFEEEPANALRSGLATTVAALPDCHGPLTVAVDRIAEVRRTTRSKAWRELMGFIDTADLLLEIFQQTAAEPKAYDKRTVESRRKRCEAVLISNCLKVFKAVAPEVKANDWRDLEASIVRYTSRKKIEPESLNRRRQRARAT